MKFAFKVTESEPERRVRTAAAPGAGRPEFQFEGVFQAWSEALPFQAVPL